jgi:tRNA(fMet)-specific endonuclease VapC
MIRYILDTDHISLFMGRKSVVRPRVLQILPECSITVISVHEVFNGWVSQINRSDNESFKTSAYNQLHEVAQFFKKIEILDYDSKASAVYSQLIRGTPKLGHRRMDKDVRIAAIALSINATVITRNRKDFEIIPGLKIENWS